MARRVSGAKSSVKFSTFFTSSGIPSWDSLIGGGFSAGSLVLVDSDFHGTYANQLTNLFIAEGFVSGHSIYYAAKEKLVNMLSRLPEVAELSKGNPTGKDDDLKIAWRYKPLNNLENTTVIPQGLGHFFDLTKVMDTDCRIKERQLSVENFEPSCSQTLQKNLSNLLLSLDRFTQSKSASNIQRIVLTSFGSPLWGSVPNEQTFDRLIRWFFASLRLLMQNTLAVIFITLSSLSSHLLSRIRHQADYVFTLTGFDGTDTSNPLYAEYNGLMHAVQLPWLGGGGGLEPLVRPSNMEWAFKVKRRQFIIKHLDLPPCLSDQVSRSTAPEPVLSCSSQRIDANNSVLNF